MFTFYKFVAYIVEKGIKMFLKKLNCNIYLDTERILQQI